MADEKKVTAPAPEADGTVFFKHHENCTFIHPVGYIPETKKYKAHKFVSVKRGVVFATNDQHEIEALRKNGVKQVSKPKPKSKVDDDE